jgi:hypothetical protein
MKNIWSVDDRVTSNCTLTIPIISSACGVNHRHNLADNVGRGAFRPWVLGTVIYEGVKVKRCERTS